mmetsp:Transcript_18100/g.23598  ORF Transcript_18100/g.23598 Transcript_18100/m.23598 type:complete len:154 (-) Transcript_18100:973-1434(-)
MFGGVRRTNIRLLGTMSATVEKILTKKPANQTTVALVGFSDKANRESNKIGHYLINQGFHVYPVNPAVASIDGMSSYASLKEVPVDHIDIVNVFRRSEFLYDITQQAIHLGAGAIWAQLGVMDDKAEALAQQNDTDYVQDSCIFVEHSKLKEC